MGEAMTDKTEQPIIDGWFVDDADGPHLIGTQCTECSTYYFPKQTLSCRNPACNSDSFREVPLSNHGKLWSFTTASYPPPPPYVSGDDFEPFILAAVELEHEKMVVLGQMVAGTDLSELEAGQPVELRLEELYEEGGVSKITWKWARA